MTKITKRINQILFPHMGREVVVISLNDQIRTKTPYNLAAAVKTGSLYFFNNFPIEVYHVLRIQYKTGFTFNLIPPSLLLANLLTSISIHFLTCKTLYLQQQVPLKHNSR